MATDKFTIAERTLVDHPRKGTPFKLTHLEDVRDYLRKIEARQNPQDVRAKITEFDLDLSVRPVVAHFTNNALGGSQLLMTRNALSQLRKHVLPSGKFFDGLKELAVMGEDGGKLATQVWHKFARHNDRHLVFRAVLMKLGNEVRPVVRASVTDRYAKYSNLQMVEDLLSRQETRVKPVLSWTVTDNVMRLRFSTIDELEKVMAQFDNDYYHKHPIPVFDMWNSETGCRSVVMKSGLYHVVKQTGLGFWSERGNVSWPHQGSSFRLPSNVTARLAEVTGAADELLQAYSQASTVIVEDPKGWVASRLSKYPNVPDRVLAAVKKALDNDAMTTDNSLSAVVDAVTLAAKEERDITFQETLESISGSILRAGLDIAMDNNGIVPKKRK